MIFRQLPVWVALLASTFIFSQEYNAPTFGKGIFNLVGKDSTWSMKIGARMQFLSVSSWDRNDQGDLINPETSFLIRRARLKFDGFAYSPKLKYKLELGLSNRDISGATAYTANAPRYILDAVVMWNFYKNFELWFGQTKLPGNVERVISSGNLQLVDRSLLNAAFNLDRDIGIQLRHSIVFPGNMLIREKVAFSQGEGRNVVTGNLGGHELTARLEVLPFGRFSGDSEYSGADLSREKTPKLMLGATYDFNNDAVRTRSNQGSYMDTDTGLYMTDVSTFLLDAVFKYNGFSLMAEYADRKADDRIAKNSDGTATGDEVLTGHGFNLQMGYLLKNNWEIAGRFSDLKLDETVGIRPETQYTLGLSRYLAGHKLKVQTDVSYLDLDDDSGVLMYRLQLDVHF